MSLVLVVYEYIETRYLTDVVSICFIKKGDINTPIHYI